MLKRSMTRESLEIKTPPDLRYEIKMVYREVDRDFVRSSIRAHSGLFKMAYPHRQVNNIYFDTHDRQLRSDHIQGSHTRSKIRFRWYRSTWDIKNGQLEIKTKQSNLGNKHVYQIPATVNLVNGRWKEIQEQISLSLPDSIRSSFSMTTPILINHYQREYYQNAERTIRITLDYDLESFDQSFFLKPNLNLKSPMAGTVVLEVKASAMDFHEISKVLTEFPKYARAYSKYLQGVEASGLS